MRFLKLFRAKNDRGCDSRPCFNALVLWLGRQQLRLNLKTVTNQSLPLDSFTKSYTKTLAINDTATVSQFLLHLDIKIQNIPSLRRTISAEWSASKRA